MQGWVKIMLTSWPRWFWSWWRWERGRWWRCSSKLLSSLCRLSNFTIQREEIYLIDIPSVSPGCSNISQIYLEYILNISYRCHQVHLAAQIYLKYILNISYWCHQVHLAAQHPASSLPHSTQRQGDNWSFFLCCQLWVIFSCRMLNSPLTPWSSSKSSATSTFPRYFKVFSLHKINHCIRIIEHLIHFNCP